MKILLKCRQQVVWVVKDILERSKCSIEWVKSHEDADMVILEPVIWEMNSFFYSGKFYAVISGSRDDFPLPTNARGFSLIWFDRHLPDYVKEVAQKKEKSRASMEFEAQP